LPEREDATDKGGFAEGRAAAHAHRGGRDLEGRLQFGVVGLQDVELLVELVLLLLDLVQVVRALGPHGGGRDQRDQRQEDGGDAVTS